jgi:GTPase SAR1 family protein
LGVWVR